MYLKVKSWPSLPSLDLHLINYPNELSSVHPVSPWGSSNFTTSGTSVGIALATQIGEERKEAQESCLKSASRIKQFATNCWSLFISVWLYWSHHLSVVEGRSYWAQLSLDSHPLLSCTWPCMLTPHYTLVTCFLLKPDSIGVCWYNVCWAYIRIITKR